MENGDGNFRRFGWIAVLLALSAGAVALVLGGARPPQSSGVKTPVGALSGKKVLFLDSYHEGYEWSDGIASGIRSKLEGTGVQLKIVHMDTKRNPEEEFKRRAGEAAKAEIERFSPDVVISADDNAFKYVVMPFYRDAKLPIVFCGINWDASSYGAPYSNTTGMVEVSLTTRLIADLSGFAKGSRIGYLSADTETERKNAFYYDKLFSIKFSKVSFVKTMKEWEDAFDRMQKEVDILIFENNAGIADWDADAAAAFAKSHTRIPVGTTNPWVMPTALMGLTKVPEEQGEWSAMRALDIIKGAKPSDIPVTTNERGDIFLNFTIADELGVRLPPALIKSAKVVR
ncbi:MAG: hypothetical protein RL272_931 [Candidatus Parcubacteria bacterium]|jgi:ABC-type uncharacterized transport system substrate-binding protein